MVGTGNWKGVDKMKILSMIVMVLLINVFAQAEELTLTWGSLWQRADSATLDSLRTVCEERGHIPGMTGFSTMMSGVPRYVDLEDCTLEIFYDPNYTTYTCQRCGDLFSVPNMTEPCTTVVWHTSEVADIVYQEEQSWEDLRYSMYSDTDSSWVSPMVHFIAGPVDVNCSTGEVVIAEGADISSASVKFWRSLEAAYPHLFGEE